MTTHFYESTGNAYDDSQCNEDVHDGDLLVVLSEGVVGFLFGAWPVAVTVERGEFHSLAPGAPYDQLALTSLGSRKSATRNYGLDAIAAQDLAAAFDLPIF